MKLMNIRLNFLLAVVLCLALAGNVRADLMATFTATPNPAAPLQTITFDASGSTGDIISWQWDFESDGNYDSSGVQVTYAFNAFGTFATSLRIVDNFGYTDLTAMDVTINQGNRPPVADPGGPYMIEIGQDLVLDGSGSYDPDASFGDDIVMYQWDLNGDGSTDLMGPAPSVSWESIETLGLPFYEANIITLTVTDIFGESNAAITTLSIVPIPGAVVLAMLGLSMVGVKLRKFA